MKLVIRCEFHDHCAYSNERALIHNNFEWICDTIKIRNNTKNKKSPQQQQHNTHRIQQQQQQQQQKLAI